MTRSRRPRGGGPAREPTAGSFNPSLAQAMAGWLLRPARASFLRRAARPAILKRLNVRASQRAATLASARARRYRAFTSNRTTKSHAWKRRYPAESDKVFGGSPIRPDVKDK